MTLRNYIERRPGTWAYVLFWVGIAGMIVPTLLGYVGWPAELGIPTFVAGWLGIVVFPPKKQ